MLEKSLWSTTLDKYSSKNYYLKGLSLTKLTIMEKSYESEVKLCNSLINKKTTNLFPLAVVTYGQVKPENLVFNANLQEFAEKVGIITSLETNGSSQLMRLTNRLNYFGNN